MSETSASRTRVSLLCRLRQNPGDQSAWEEFVDRYSAKIDSWCRRWGLQEADAQDVTQMVLVKLASKMRGFVYDPQRSFRAWLKTVTRHAWSDFVADQQVAAGTGDSRVLQMLQTAEARDDLETHLQGAFDLELLEHAKDQVQRRVEANTWEAFRLTAVEGMSGAEAAAQLGMKVAAVFKAKSNVQKLLREEITLLEREA